MSEQTNFVSDANRIATTYLQEFSGLVSRIDVNAICRVAKLLAEARKKSATIFIAGNGGSAAISSHWVNDLGKATKRSEYPPMRVLSLSDNVSWLTALANDEGYERVFSGQLENFANPDDVLIVISSSGNSMNLVRAVELAKSRNLRTIGLLGFSGGKLKNMVDEHIVIETDKGAYGLVEPAHEMLCHLITKCLAEA
jgi:D-sedoheptulose 7-phosphate isomerase